jgi:hypothetical protein
VVSLGKLTKKEVNPPLYFEILLHQSLKRRICHLNHIHTTTVLKQRIDNIHVKGFQMKTRTNARKQAARKLPAAIAVRMCIIIMEYHNCLSLTVCLVAEPRAKQARVYSVKSIYAFG